MKINIESSFLHYFRKRFKMSMLSYVDVRVLRVIGPGAETRADGEEVVGSYWLFQIVELNFLGHIYNSIKLTDVACG